MSRSWAVWVGIIVSPSKENFNLEVVVLSSEAKAVMAFWSGSFWGIIIYRRTYKRKENSHVSFILHYSYFGEAVHHVPVRCLDFDSDSIAVTRATVLAVVEGRFCHHNSICKTKWGECQDCSYNPLRSIALHPWGHCKKKQCKTSLWNTPMMSAVVRQREPGESVGLRVVLLCERRTLLSPATSSSSVSSAITLEKGSNWFKTEKCYRHGNSTIISVPCLLHTCEFCLCTALLESSQLMVQRKMANNHKVEHLKEWNREGGSTRHLPC